MPTPQQVIFQLASLVHQHCLKPLGFRKSGNTWISSEPWPRVINWQLSQSNSSDEARFTINLGVSILELHAALELPPVRGALKEDQCDVRQRLGLLIHGKDYWWEVRGGDDPAAMVQPMVEALESFALPWLEKLSGYRAVGDELERGNPFFAAVAFQLGGHRAEAQAAMKLAFNKSPMALPRMKRIALAQSIFTAEELAALSNPKTL